MVKKIIFIVFTSSLILCTMTGCSESTPKDELVNNGQDKLYDIPAGSSFVENEKTQQSGRTFPTLLRLRESVKEEMGDNYWPEISLSEKELEEKTGITQDMYVEFFAEEQLLDANIDMMIIIHAKEDYVGAIEQALEEYRSRMIEENRKYPQNLGKAEASRMETIENYICFVQLGADTSIVADKGKEEIIAYCQEENERAIDILEKAILQ